MSANRKMSEDIDKHNAAVMGLIAERDHLKEQNKELAEALKGLLAACEAVDEGYYPIDAIEPAKAILAKVQP